MTRRSPSSGFATLGWFAAAAAVVVSAAASLPIEALPDFVEVPASVNLPAFYIARREVTVGQFSAFARESRWPVDLRALSGGSGQPVAFVSWPDAMAYCRWLETALKSAPSPPYVQALLREGWRVAMPTETEWERGPRGGGDFWEWTRSPYHPGLDADALWVIRGGRARDSVPLVTADTRGGADPGARRPFIGFRVALSRPVLPR